MLGLGEGVVGIPAGNLIVTVVLNLDYDSRLQYDFATPILHDDEIPWFDAEPLP
jgi:hypothetical protein